MKRKRMNSVGASLAEVLIALAILVILMSVVFVAVAAFMRSYSQMEYDGIAKEIFIAAQNHLTAADSQGYLGRTGVGTKETFSSGGSGDSPEIYYFIVGGTNEGSAEYASPGDGSSLLNLMLPLASIDETVRLGGSYVIRYQTDPAQVLDVFYSPKSGRYGHVYTAAEYEDLIKHYRDDTDGAKGERRDYSGAVLGYYGGVEALKLTSVEILTPTFELINGERLYVNVVNPNPLDPSTAIRIKLIVEGKTSGNIKPISLVDWSGTASQVNYSADGGMGRTFTVVFDDVTAPNQKFCYQFCSSAGFPGTGDLIPGEDIDVKVVAYSNKCISNVAETAVKTANSLYSNDTVVTVSETIDNSHNVADIKNMRHLENLSSAVSGVLDNPDSTTAVGFPKAVQSNDLSWSEFKSSINSSSPDSVQVYYFDGQLRGELFTGDQTGTVAGCFLPVDPPVGGEYDGQSHRVSDVTVNIAGNAGLFGSLVKNTVKDLELLDFTVRSSAGPAGALAGHAGGSSGVFGVLARNTAAGGESAYEILGNGAAGGLIGVLDDSSVYSSAAALYVQSETGAAGGLAGTASGGTISGSYAGGHTEDGAYLSTTAGVARVNVLAATSAGGLVGETAGTAVAGSYSTCSAKGTGAGGLIGAAGTRTDSGSVKHDTAVTDSYATGLVIGDPDKTGSFIGTIELAGSEGIAALYTDNYYFGAVTGDLRSVGSGGAAAAPFDSSVDSYNDFAFKGNYRESVSTAPYAFAYDDYLVLEFGGRTDMPTLDVLYGRSHTQQDTAAWIGELPGFMKDEAGSTAKHWGDWPSPETKVINEPAT